MSEPFKDCLNCERDGFNIVNGVLIICSSCNGTGLIVIN